jgi:hypothetical protein
VSIIPLDLQRRFEQRWAARFASNPGPTKDHQIQTLTVNIAPRGKAKKKLAGMGRPGRWSLEGVVYPRAREAE